MANYKNGEGTKELIIKTCAELFYEEGYENISMSDISKAAEVNRALLYYHFKTKEELRLIIACECALKCMYEAEYYTKNHYLSSVVSEYIFWYKFLKDEKHRAFQVCSCKGGDFWVDKSLNYIEDNTTNASSFMEYEFNQQDNDMLKQAFARGVNSQAILYVADHLNEYDFMQVTENVQAAIFKIYGVPEKSVKDVIDNARKLLKLVPFEELDTTLYGTRGTAV